MADLVDLTYSKVINQPCRIAETSASQAFFPVKMTQMEAVGVQYSRERLLFLRRFDPNSFGDLGISLIEAPEASAQRAKPRKPKGHQPRADVAVPAAVNAAVPDLVARPSEETTFGAPGLKVDPTDLLPDWAAPPTGPPPGFLFDAPPQSSSLEDDGFWAESMHPNLATAALQEALGLTPPLPQMPPQPPWPLDPLGYPAVPGLVPPWALQTEPLLAPPELAPPELAPPELPEPVTEAADAPAEGVAGRWRRRAARAASALSDPVADPDEGVTGGVSAPDPEALFEGGIAAEALESKVTLPEGGIATEPDASAAAEPEGAPEPDAMQAMVDEDPAELSEEAAVNGAEKKKSKKKKKKNKKEDGVEDAAAPQVPQVPQVLSAHFSKTRFAGLHSDSEEEQKPVGQFFWDPPLQTANLGKIGAWQAKAKPKAKPKEAKATPPAATPAPVAKVPPPPTAAKVPPAAVKAPPAVAAVTVPPAAAKASPAAAKVAPPTAAVKVPPVQPVQPLQQVPRPVPMQVAAEAKKAPEGNRSGALNGINGEVKQSFKAPPGVAVKPAPPKAKAKAVPMGMNPLPQQIRPKAPVSNGWNPSSLTMRYAERPVEKVSTSRQEEDVDPDLQCYIWDSRSQQPRQPRQPIATGRPSVPNAKQRQLLNQVVEMGFNETDAKRALSSTGWSGVQDAVAVLVGG
eukprot:s928_g7.t4